MIYSKYTNHCNVLEYRMEMTCHFDKLKDDARWLDLSIFLPKDRDDGHFTLEYDDVPNGDKVMITEECNIKQLKKLYILLKGVFENEL